MIVSITCCDGTESNVNRGDVFLRLLNLMNLVPNIVKAEVVFSKETHHKKYDELITCHLSVHIPHIRPLDIYDHQPSENQAFDHANDRMIKTIRRNQSSRLNMRQVKPEHLGYLTEEIA